MNYQARIKELESSLRELVQVNERILKSKDSTINSNERCDLDLSLSRADRALKGGGK